MNENLLSIQDVRKKLLTMNVEQVPVYHNASKFTALENVKLVRRVDNKQPIRILSDDYPAEQLINTFDRVIENLERSALNYNIQKLTTNEKPGRNSMHLTFGFPEISWDVDGSNTMATFEVMDSNDGLMKYNELFGMYRLICSNGMIIGKTVYQQKRKHSKNFLDRLDDFDKFYDCLLAAKEFGKVFEKSQEVKITKRFTEMLIKAGFSSRILNNLPEFFIKYSNDYQETIKDYTKLWAIWAVMTNYLTHVVALTDIKRANMMNATLTRMMVNEIG